VRQWGSAFTIVELLIIVAIIALLAALMMPVLHKAPLQSRQAACLSNQHQIIVAVSSYASNSGVGRFPPCIARDDLTSYYAPPTYLNFRADLADANARNDGGSLYAFLRPYLPRENIYQCPCSGSAPAIFQEEYEAGNTAYLSGSYFLWWGHRGFDTTFRPPVGLDASDETLVTADLYMYDSSPGCNAWYSSHPLPGASLDRSVAPGSGHHVRFYLEDPSRTVPAGICFGAGYVDGHTESFESQDSQSITLVTEATSEIFLPEKL
jgi:type II secretory pathway pseudopilin PulG